MAVIEDGDIGYAGEKHLSFVGQPLGPIGGPPTPFGSQMAQRCRELVERFRTVPNAAPSRRVTEQAYRSAVRRAVLGV